MSVAESILCRSNGVQLGYFGIFCRANSVLWDNPGTICTLCGAAQKTCHRNISSKIAPVVNSIVNTTVVNTEHCHTTECQMTLLDTCLCLQTKWAFAHHHRCVCHFVETWSISMMISYRRLHVWGTTSRAQILFSWPIRLSYFNNQRPGKYSIAMSHWSPHLWT